MKVQTTDGLVEREELEVHDLIQETEDLRITATEWFRDGRLVRRDVNLNVLRGLSMTAEARH